MIELQGAVAVVTGASSGLGRRFCLDLAARGAVVTGLARREDLLEDVGEEMRRSSPASATIVCDVSDTSGYASVLAGIERERGRVDVLINNAGIGTAHPATRETPEQFRSVIDVNLNGAYWVAQACGRVMQPGSSIINIASVLGITTADLPQAAYSASKAAIIGLTRDLARLPRQLDGSEVDVPDPVFEAVAGELDPVGAEGVGLDQLRPGGNVRTVNLLDDLGLREIELVEGALEADAPGMELGAHGAVPEEGTAPEPFEERMIAGFRVRSGTHGAQ